MASLSNCHLEIVVWDGNLVKSMINVDNRTIYQHRAVTADKTDIAAPSNCWCRAFDVSH